MRVVGLNVNGLRAAERKGVRVLRTDLPNGVALVNVYAPSGSSGEHRQAAKMAFLERFLPYLRDLSDEGRDALVVGDLNIAHAEIDLRNWRANGERPASSPRSGRG